MKPVISDSITTNLTATDLTATVVTTADDVTTVDSATIDTTSDGSLAAAKTQSVTSATPATVQPGSLPLDTASRIWQRRIGIVITNAGLAIIAIILILLLDGQAQQWVRQRQDYLIAPGNIKSLEPLLHLLAQKASIANTLSEASPTSQQPATTVAPIALSLASLNPLAATPIPAAIPLLPPVRIYIPAISVTSNIVETKPISKTSRSGKVTWQWEAADHAVGHQQGSGLPGGNNNIVLTGHNNTQGEVFRYLDQLQLEDEVILYTESGEHRYRVRDKRIVPYRSQLKEGEAAMQLAMASTSKEIVTLMSCYPYLTNADRIIVVAEPAPLVTGNQ